MDPVFGLSYARVPRELKTALDGSMIEEEDLINFRGTKKIESDMK